MRKHRGWQHWMTERNASVEGRRRAVSPDVTLKTQRTDLSRWWWWLQYRYTAVNLMGYKSKQTCCEGVMILRSISTSPCFPAARHDPQALPIGGAWWCRVMTPRRRHAQHRPCYNHLIYIFRQHCLCKLQYVIFRYINNAEMIHEY